MTLSEKLALYGVHWYEHETTPDCDCGMDNDADQYLAALEQRARDES